MNPLNLFTTPEYVFQPGQMLRRLGRCFTGRPPTTATVRLPWGQVVAVHPREVIGAAVWWYGIFDLAVAETIARLLDPGETAIDVGANFGQMTSLMAHVTGAQGRVLAFEPHPLLHRELEAIGSGGEARATAPVTAHQLGLSDAPGEGFLQLGSDWAQNRGLGRVVSAAATGEKVSIRLTTLDTVLPPDAAVGVCKIDVEGHEPAVFGGAARVLATRQVRDFVFEDLGCYPSEVHTMLARAGYALFALHTKLLRPVLVPCTAGGAGRFGRRDGANYIATLDPRRAMDRFRPLGWRALGRQPAARRT